MNANAFDYAPLFEALTPFELANLRELQWEKTPQAAESVNCIFEEGVGVTFAAGALPFLETRKGEIDAPLGSVFAKSDSIAQFLVQNRALGQAYLLKAQRERLTIAARPARAKIFQVTAHIKGVETAAAAVFIASEATKLWKKILLVDADTENQFIFSLLRFDALPPLLTEQLEKPSTFRADLKKCIVPAFTGVDYLNLQATSLRPFEDAEICRIAGFLDEDYDAVVWYSGKRHSAYMSANADATFAVIDNSYKAEIAALATHAHAPHTVLLRKEQGTEFPGLGPAFSRALPTDFWASENEESAYLRRTVRRLLSAYRIVLGESELVGTLPLLHGAALYFKLSCEEEAKKETSLNALQKKMRAYYPKDAFFSARSAYRSIERFAPLPVTTLIEVDGYPRLVSLPRSGELLATAVFPRATIPSLQHKDVRLTAANAGTLARFTRLAARGGFTHILHGEKLSLDHPNALASLMEQMQL